MVIIQKQVHRDFLITLYKVRKLSSQKVPVKVVAATYI
jgi:hypothetical protein